MITILILILTFVLMFLIIPFFLIIWNLDILGITSNFITGIISGIIAALITIGIIFRTNAKIQLEDHLRGIFVEITQYNEEKLFKIHQTVQLTKKYWEYYKSYNLSKSNWILFHAECGDIDVQESKNEFNYRKWIQPKSVILISYNRKWLYQYLSNNAFNAFIQSNFFQYYIKKRSAIENYRLEYLSELESLKRYYYLCDKLSDETQFIEDIIDEVCELIHYKYRIEIENQSIKKEELDSKIEIKFKNIDYQDSISCIIKIGDNEENLSIFRKPLYFKKLDRHNSYVKYPEFVDICFRIIFEIVTERSKEIDEAKRSVLKIPEFQGQMTEEIWVKHISKNVRFPSMKSILENLFTWF